jgi:hypothetical protein
VLDDNSLWLPADYRPPPTNGLLPEIVSSGKSLCHNIESEESLSYLLSRQATSGQVEQGQTNELTTGEADENASDSENNDVKPGSKEDAAKDMSRDARSSTPNPLSLL